MTGQIVTIGGGTFLTDDLDPRLDAFILALTGKPPPRICCRVEPDGRARADRVVCR